ncbi:MAG: LysE family transporter [Desulfarculaceae bacterium]
MESSLATYFMVVIKGLASGVAVSAPLGPVGILCLRRTWERGRLAGLISGLGSASADALFALIAAFGLSQVAEFLARTEFWLRLGGGLFVCVLGIWAFFSRPAAHNASSSRRGWFGDWTSAFLITATNPLIIFSLAAIFASVGLGPVVGVSKQLGVILVLSVFLGSMTWFTTLTFLAGLFRRGLDHTKLKWINRITGAVLVVMGLVISLGVLT